MAFNAGAITGTIELNTSPLAGAVARAKSMMGDLRSSTSRAFSGVASGAGKLALVGLGVGAAVVGIRGAFDALSLGPKLAAEAEQAEVAFGTMLGSAEAAKQVLADLNQFAAETPFDMPGLTDAARKLIAFGTGGDQVVPELRAIGDIASGTGQSISELAEIYGKARVQGRLMAEDINQLTGRGIPIIGELAKQFGVAESQVKGLIAEGKIGFSNLQRAFVALTAEGGKFSGMMAAQSQTLSGLISTLQDNLGMMLRDISADLMQTFDVKGLADEFAQAVPIIQDFLGGAIEHVIELASSLARSLGITGDAGERGGNRIIAAMEWVLKGVATLADWLELPAAGFYGLQTGATAAISFIVKAIDLAGQALTSLINLLPGVEVEWTNTFAIMAEELDREVAKSMDKASHHFERFSGGANSKALAAFFDQAKAKAKDAANAAAGVTDAITIDDSSAGTLPEKVAASLAKLQQEIDRFSLSDLQKQLADFSAMEGVTDDAIEQFRQQLDTLRGLQAGAELDKLGMELDAIGMSDVEKRMAELRREGLFNDDELAEARRLLDEINTQSKVKTAIESIKTPLDELDAKMAEFNKWLEEGRINQQQFNQLAGKARDEAFGEAKLAPLIRAGSAADLALQFEQSRGATESRDVPKQQLNEQKKTNGLLTDVGDLMRRLVESNDVPAPPVFV